MPDVLAYPMPSGPQLALIAAVDRNLAIGASGQLPWHYPADLKRFKALTLGHAILMGRKTFDSIGKPLPGRRNLVLTRAAIAHSGIESFDSLDAALGAVDGPIWVIGGGEIYALCLPLAQRLELTRIPLAIENADAWFPAFSSDSFECVSRQADQDLVFERWERCVE